MVYAKFSCKQVFGFTKFLDVLSRIVCHMCGAPENGVIRGVSLGRWCGVGVKRRVGCHWVAYGAAY